MSSVARSNEPEASAEIVIQRLFRAPRQLVYEAWTTKEHFARWFGPRDFAVEVYRLEARPGGSIHFCHRFPDGRSLWVKGSFLEAEPPSRLVLTAGFVDEAGRPAAHPMFPDWPLEARVLTTVTLESDAQGTLMTIRQVVEPTALANVEPVKTERRMAREGWDETLERLAEALSA